MVRDPEGDVSPRNGNGNGRTEYERADTPPSGNEFGDLLKLARSVKDTEIALGIMADDVSMLKAGVHRVHVAVQAMRAENESHNAANERRVDDVTAAVLALTASVNDALELGRRAVMKAESAERVSISNEAAMDLAKDSVAVVKTQAERSRDSLRVRADRQTHAIKWLDDVRKHVWIPLVIALGVAVVANLKGC